MLPKHINFASSGLGSSNHMAGELLKVMAKVDIEHIPYKGNNPALTDTWSDLRRRGRQRRFAGAAVALARVGNARAYGTMPSGREAQ